MSFERKFEHVNELMQEDLFNNYLWKDIVKPYIGRPTSGDVFPAIRKDKIEFYHKGGLLFSYNINHGFSTNQKYASVLKVVPNQVNVTEEQLGGIKCISNFMEGYQRIKENCRHYSGLESSRVAELCSKFSCAKSERTSTVVVLDIEVSFKREEDADEPLPGESDRAKSDRIDIVLFDIETRRLLFVEAKDFSNQEIRAEGEPAIVDQIDRYKNQLNNDATRLYILTEYKKHINVINALFPNPQPLPEPIDISREPLLLIFGYDGVQKVHKLSEEKSRLEQEYDISVYSIGNISNANIQTIFNAGN
jgi:hypothetical protein